ncbi:hypothetical protein [Roseateles sp. BYS87W]|uniref:Uncharacterized protein n=1 Tax=Pelomonas baiyunensis TaxID=3299026 RepID=A0ABW7H295_9BURK
MALIASRSSGTTVTDLVTLGPVQAPRHGLLGGGWGVGVACSARPAAERHDRLHKRRATAPQAGAGVHQP